MSRVKTCQKTVVFDFFDWVEIIQFPLAPQETGDTDNPPFCDMVKRILDSCRTDQLKDFIKLILCFQSAILVYNDIVVGLVFEQKLFGTTIDRTHDMCVWKLCLDQTSKGQTDTASGSPNQNLVIGVNAQIFHRA